MCLNIVYEDKNVLIINKQSNICVNNLHTYKNKTLKDLLLIKYPYLINVQNNGIVHRLDKNTTGLIIIVKDNESFNIIKNDFLNKNIVKKYLSLVTGNILFSGYVKTSILRSNFNRTKMIVNNFGKKSFTHYSIIENLYLHTYIKLNIKTGRTHQIRLHMSYINHPLVGDIKYSNNSSNYKKSIDFLSRNNILFNRHALHSYKLKFKHPITKKILNIKISCSKDILKLINLIKTNS